MKGFLSTICLCGIVFLHGHGQMLPKVPADMPAYKQEMKDMVNTNTRQMTEWIYVIYDGNVTNDKYKSRIVKYDTRGRMKENIILNSKGEKKSILIFNYDNSGLPLSEVEYLPSGEILGQTVYSYSTKPTISQITWYHGGEYIIDMKKYEADFEQHILREQKFYSPDSIEQTIVYHYSDLSSGYKEKEEVYQGKESLKYSTVFIRNDVGRVIKEDWFDAESKLDFSIEYTYSPEGKVVLKEKLYPGGSRIKHQEYQYSELLLRTGEILYNDKGEIVRYRKFSYK